MKYGFYSEKQSSLIGTSLYGTPSGGTVVITQVEEVPDSTPFMSRPSVGEWKDYIPTGEVTEQIRRVSEGRINLRDYDQFLKDLWDETYQGLCLPPNASTKIATVSPARPVVSTSLRGRWR